MTTKTECTTCPDWVVRCAHFGDKWLVVHKSYSKAGLYATCLGNGAIDMGDGYYNHEHSIEQTNRSISLEEAEQRFREWEPRLLED